MNANTKILHILSNKLLAVKTERADLEEALKGVKGNEELYTQELVKMLVAQGISSFKRDDGILIGTTQKTKFYVTNKPELLELIKRMGWMSLVKEDIPWQTLQSTMKQLQEESETKGGIYKNQYDQLLALMSTGEERSIFVRGRKK